MQQPKVLIIGIGGGTCSGKTSVSKKIHKLLIKKGIRAIIISQDKFYKTMKSNLDPLKYNFDVPKAFDDDLILSSLVSLKNRNVTYIPEYDYIQHKQSQNATLIPECDIVIFEGILALYFEPIIKLMDLKIYVDTPSDIRLARRILRDAKERGRSVEGILMQYFNTVRDAHETYVEPTKHNTDLTIPLGKQNHSAIAIAVSHIENLYNQNYN